MSNIHKDENPVTTQGDIIVGNSTGVPARLAIGAADTVLKSNATTATYGKIVNANVDAAAAIDNSKLVLTPSTMTDAAATALGHKLYVAGTNYNGGISPTVAVTGWTTVRAIFVPYQMQDGTWRLRMNVGGTTGSVTSIAPVINGVTFKNTADFIQPVTTIVTNTQATRGACGIGDGTVSMTATSGTTGWRFSGDVELESKPTWAY